MTQYVDVDSNSPGLSPGDEDQVLTDLALGQRRIGGYMSPIHTVAAARAEGFYFGQRWKAWDRVGEPVGVPVFEVSMSDKNKDNPVWAEYCRATQENQAAWMEGFRAGLKDPKEDASC